MRNHMTILLVMILGIYLAIHFGIVRYVVVPSFEGLESNEAQRNMNRVIATLEREIQLLDRLAFDWASWDDAYAYMENRNEAFAKGNLIKETFRSNKLDMLYFIDLEGQVVWGRYYDVNMKQVSSDQFPAELWPQNHPLLVRPEGRDGVQGIMLDSHRILMVAARPIMRSNHSGPVRGTLVMGRILDRAARLQLSEQTHVAVEIWSMIGETYPEKEGLLQEFEKKPLLIKRASERELHVFAIHKAIGGKASILLRIEMTRDITLRAQQAMQLALLSVLCSSILLVLGMYIWLRRSVVVPLVALAEEVSKRDKTVEPDEALLERNDEVGELARAYTQVLKELSEEQSHLAEQSYVIGKNEVISGIMHNIRNGLHPVAAFTDLLLQDAREAPLEDLEAAIREWESDDIPPERKAALLEFMVLSLKELIHLQYDARESLGKIIHQTKQVIQTASSYKQSLTSSTLESVTWQQLISDAHKALPPWEKDGLRMRIHPSLAAAPSFKTQKLQLQKVLTNLLLFAPLPAPEEIDLELRLGIPEREESQLCLEIVHSRVTLDPDELERMFERGYTGFRSVPDQGLHWCANTVNALGGRIKVLQAYGSTIFQLTIPKK